VLAIAGVVLMTTYFARWWPYTHWEDFQFTVISSSGQTYVSSACIPLPLLPCLLLGTGAALWIVSVLRRPKVRGE
jgi:4-hydroxybenzoate polyprenyltransferase